MANKESKRIDVKILSYIIKEREALFAEYKRELEYLYSEWDSDDIIRCEGQLSYLKGRIDSLDRVKVFMKQEVNIIETLKGYLEEEQ